MKVLKYIFVVYFFLIMALLSYEAREPQCINSKVVGILDIGNGAQIFSCGYKKEILGDLDVQALQSWREARETLLEMERFLEKNKILPAQSLDLFIEYEKGSFARTVLTQALLKINSQRDFFEAVVVADFLEKLIFGKNQMDDHYNPSYILISERSACLNQIAPAENSYCELAKNHVGKLEGLDHLSYWSLRPMIYSLVLRKYKGLSLQDKMDFLNRIISKWKREIPREDLYLVDIFNIESFFEKVSRRLFSFSKPLQASHHVLLKDALLTDPLEPLLKKVDRKSQALLYIQDGYYNNYGFVLAPLNLKLNAQKVFWIAHDWPRLKDIEGLSVKHLHVYKSTGEHMRIHVPSLRLMYRLRIATPNQTLEQLQKQDLSKRLGFSPLEVVL